VPDGYGGRVRTALRPAVAAVLSLLALAGCSSGGDKTAEQSPAQQLATARANLEKSPAVDFTLESTGLPGKAVGVSAAKGTGVFTPPSFQGTLNASVRGITGTVQVVAVEQDVYMKFFTPSFVKIDPAKYGAPNPAQLFDTSTGVTSLITKTQDLAKGSTVRDGADVLNTFTGKLPGDAVADLLVTGDRSGTFDVTYGVTRDDKQLRSVVIKGPFYAGATSTYTLHLTSLAKAVAITRP